MLLLVTMLKVKLRFDLLKRKTKSSKAWVVVMLLLPMMMLVRMMMMMMMMMIARMMMMMMMIYGSESFGRLQIWHQLGGV